jgi:hypothetical protein
MAVAFFSLDIALCALLTNCSMASCCILHIALLGAIQKLWYYCLFLHVALCSLIENRSIAFDTYMLHCVVLLRNYGTTVHFLH